MSAVTLLCTRDDTFAFETYEKDREHMMSETQLKYDIVRAASIIRRLDRGSRTTFIVHRDD